MVDFLLLVGQSKSIIVQSMMQVLARSKKPLMAMSPRSWGWLSVGALFDWERPGGLGGSGGAEAASEDEAASGDGFSLWAGAL